MTATQHLPPCAALALLLALVASPALATTGDADGDGNVDFDDVSALIDELLARGDAAGDPDCDASGALSIADAVCTLRLVPCVIDTVPPRLVAPAAGSIDLSAQWSCHLPVPFPVVDDDCDPNPLVTAVPDTITGLGQHAITLTARDEQGNEASVPWSIDVTGCPSTAHVGLGKVEGTVLVDQDGVLSLASSDPPSPGQEPLIDGKITVSGTQTSALTDASGHFTIEGVEPGSKALLIESTTNGAGALPPIAPIDVPVTVIADATIVPGPRPISREQARDVVLALLGADFDPAEGFLYVTQQPLPAGVILQPALGNDDGAPDGALDVVLAAESWLVLADPKPHLRFQHDVVQALVSSTTGVVQVLDRGSWLELNGGSFYAPPALDALSPDAMVFPDGAAGGSSVPATAPVDAAPDMGAIASHVPGCASNKTYAVIIGGADDYSLRKDLTNIRTVFGHGGVPAAFLSSFQAPSLHPVDDVTALFDAQCAATTECDTLFVYISAHGNPGGSAQLETTRTEKDGTPVIFDSFLVSQLNFAACKACHIIVIIDTCYSGKAIPGLQAKLQPLTGREALVLTATDATHQSVAFSWYNLGRSSGGKFTNELVEAAQTAVDMSAAFDTARQATLNDFNSDIKAMNPQKWVRTRPPGETCLLPGTAYVALDQALTSGSVTIPAGTHVPLSVITGGHVSGPDVGCNGNHYHGGGQTIMIEGSGPYTDPAPGNCGFGRTFTQ
jgi:hypothetical protein